MNPLTPGQLRTLRQLTKNGKLRTFATSLANDVHSRHLRVLVDNGYLTYEYTGTQRVYTLTEVCGSRFPVALEGIAVAKKKTESTADSQADEGHEDKKVTFSKSKKENTDESAPAPTKNHQDSEPPPRKSKSHASHHDTPTPTMKTNDESEPTPRKSKPYASHPDMPSPTLTDLLAVGEIAAQHGGAKKLLAVVSQVDELAKKVGGIDRLRRSLEGLETLAKLFK